MPADPPVSVLLPVRDGGAYLPAALSSIQAQLYRDFEIIAVDDRSGDRSGEILAAAALRDPRIHIIQSAGTGLVDALNLGLTACRGQLVARMDADDIAHPQRLARQVARMAADPHLIVLGGAVRLIDAHGVVRGHNASPRGSRAVDRSLSHASPVAHPTVMFRRDAIRRLGGYRRWFLRCEDYDLWLRCRSALGERAIDNLSDTVLDYRIHGESQSGRHALEQAERSEIAWWLHRLRQQGLPEPALDGEDAVAACALFPEPWRRWVRASLLLRRAPYVGNAEQDAGQMSLAMAMRADATPSEAAEVLHGVSLRAAGREVRRHQPGRAMMTLARACAASPSRTILALCRRAIGMTAIREPALRRSITSAGES
jgi:hypothetical protein